MKKPLLNTSFLTIAYSARSSQIILNQPIEIAELFNWQELRLLIRNSFPLILNEVFYSLTFAINIYFIGTLNQPELLSALGLAYSFFQFFGLYCFICINNGFLVLAAQAYGKKEFNLLGIYYYRALFINIGFYLILALILLNFKFIGSIFGYNQELIDNAQISINALLPQLFFFSLFDLTRNFLNAQGIFYPILYIQILSTIWHILSAYICVNILNLELIGIGVAKSFTEIINVLVLFTYIYLKKPIDLSLFKFNTKCLEELLNFAKIIIPISLVTYLDLMCYESITLIAGWLPTIQLAAHVALSNIYCLFVAFPIGLAMNMTNYIARFLGASKIHTAKIYSFNGFLFNLFIQAISLTVLIVGKNSVSSLFTKNAEMIQILFDLQYIFYSLLFFDFLQLYLAGLMRAVLKENEAVLICMISQFIVGLPLAYILAYHFNKGVIGIWFGWNVGIIITCLSYLYIIFHLDWKKQSILIIKRLKQENENEQSEIELNEAQKYYSY